MTSNLAHTIPAPARRVLLVAAVLALTAAVQGECAGDEAVLRDAWFVLKIDGAQAGTLHERVYQVDEDGKITFRTVVSSNLDLVGLGQKKQTRTECRTTEDSSGIVLRVNHRTVDARGETICDLVAQGDEAVLTLDDVHDPETSTISWTPDLLGPEGILRLRRDKGFEPGTTYSYQTFSTDYTKIVNVTVEVKGSAEAELLDRRQVTLIHAAKTIDLLPGVVVDEWWDEEGAVIKTSTNLMGRKRETFRTTAERANDAKSPGTEAALLLEKASVADINLPNPCRLDSILFRFEARDRNIGLPAGIDDVRQKTIQSDGRSATVLVRALNPSGYQQRPLKDPPEDIAPYLAPNPVIESDDGAIVAAARQAAGKEKDSWRAAQLLERFVFEHIADKKFETGFASAAEALESGTGDSTEHAVLLAALCRSLGIPARVAMGYKYLGGIFGGHMWTEVWIHGHWYALDGVSGRGRVDPSLIRFTASSLNEGELGESFVSAVRGLGNLDIEILEFTQGSRTVTVGKKFKDYAVDGDRYTNILYGISFTRPAGCSLVHYERDFTAMTFSLVSVKGGTSMVLKAMPVAYTFSMDDFRQRIKTQGSLVRSVTDVEVAGRGGKVFVTDSKGQRRRILVLVEAETCFVFEALIKDGERDAQTFETVIASIGFDRNE